MLMTADDEEALRREGCCDPLQHRLLQRRCEIGEGEIAAQDQIEAARRGLLADVLLQELDALLVHRPQAPAPVVLREGLRGQLGRELTQTCRRVAGAPGAIEKGLVDIGCDNAKGRGRKPRPYLEIPQDLHRIGLFP
jgi:hypothetical protein